MKILYFAWIRERVGVGQEELELPDNVKTVAEFLNWMRGRGEEFAYALESESTVRVALDQVHCSELATSVRGVKEIALFPPMTGG
jgi:molybdopterin synthase sulfur carrier subunit